MKFVVDMIKGAVSDAHAISGTDPVLDHGVIDAYLQRGLPALCKYLKNVEDSCIFAMKDTTIRRTGFLSKLPAPLARACCAMLSKFDDGLATQDTQKWESCWSAKVELESAMRVGRSDPRIHEELRRFSKKFLHEHAEPLVPRHSGGAVAEGFSPPEKYTSQTWGFNIHEFDSTYRGPHISKVKRVRNETAKFFCVPKDATKLRTISIEPAHRIYMQHAVRRYILRVIAKNYTLRTALPLHDQAINADKAWKEEFATIDLSNASDSIRTSHIYSLLSNMQNVRRWCFATRCTHLRYGTKAIALVSYAGMGNATTFVLESLLFYALAYQAIEQYSSDPIRGRSAREALRTLSVYGDDIVVHKVWAADVLDSLKRAGFQPNMSKTCIIGPFYESCGSEWYNHIDVTPPRIRTVDTSSLPYRELHARLRRWGFNSCLRILYDHLRDRPEAQMLLYGRHSRDLILRYDKPIQTMTWRIQVERPKTHRLDPSLALHKFLSEGSSTVLNKYGRTLDWIVAGR